MREITARALAGAVGGILVHEGDAPSVEHISLDSRKMTGNGSVCADHRGTGRRT